jgi:hypothetical protein
MNGRVKPRGLTVIEWKYVVLRALGVKQEPHLNDLLRHFLGQVFGLREVRWRVEFPVVTSNHLHIGPSRAPRRKRWRSASDPAVVGVGGSRAALKGVVSRSPEEQAQRNFDDLRRAFPANPEDPAVCNKLAWALVTSAESSRHGRPLEQSETDHHSETIQELAAFRAEAETVLGVEPTSSRTTP